MAPEWGLLGDQHYFSTFEAPYDFHEVTGRTSTLDNTESPGWSISRILSSGSLVYATKASSLCCRLGDHLSGTHGLPLPRAAYPELKGDEQPLRSCLALLPMGVAWPRHYCARRWSLTPPFHPYRHCIQAVCFCGPIRQVAPPRVLPGIMLCGVRTFLDRSKLLPRSPDQPGSIDDTEESVTCKGRALTEKCDTISLMRQISPKNYGYPDFSATVVNGLYAGCSGRRWSTQIPRKQTEPLATQIPTRKPTASPTLTPTPVPRYEWRELSNACHRVQ